MFRIQELRVLFRHQEWADARVWSAIDRVPAAHRDRRLRDLMFHVHATQQRFFDLWQARPWQPPDPAHFEAPGALPAWARAGHVEIARWLETTSDPELAAPFVMPWSERLAARFGAVPHPLFLGDTAYHVIAHSSYHRAQANTRLRELDSEPPVLDYIAWVWLGRPAAEWPDDPGPESPNG